MGSFRNNQKWGAGPPPGSQKGPWRGPTLGRAGCPPGCPVWPLDAPLRLYLPLGMETPKQEPFFAKLSVPPPPPFSDRGCLEKLLRHPAGRKSPLRETLPSHRRSPREALSRSDEHTP